MRRFTPPSEVRPSRPNQSTIEYEIQIFVYGTLKRGCLNHDPYCRGASSIEPAALFGRLFECESGFPVLIIPEEDVLAPGAGSPAADADVVEAVRKSFELQKASFDKESRSIIRGAEGWRLIHGELITFDHGVSPLPDMDSLEGYHPGDPGIYRRVLAPVFCDGSVVLPAWVYILGDTLEPMEALDTDTWPCP